MKSLESALVAYVKRHLSSLPHIYRWSFDLEQMAVTLRGPISGSTWPGRAFSLKQLASRQWKLSTSENKLSIANLAVCDWGRVRGNLPRTMQRYVECIATGQLPAVGVKGIASWSKIATFANPKKYAIFDARVAFALNAVQAIAGCSKPLLFPRLPSRNGLLTSTWPMLRAKAKNEAWKKLEACDVYLTYLDLLAAVASRARCRLDEVEMLLFAQAEVLAQELGHRLLKPGAAPS